MSTISGEAALAEFRSRLTGGYGLDLVLQHAGGVLIQLPVGVGKSRWIDEITIEAVQSGIYDLVVVLCPTRQLIEEREPLRNPPAGVRVVNLRPRPSERCGRKRDKRWRQLENADNGALGRVEVCGNCPVRRRCFWPGQYGQALRQAQIVYGTQTHLERSPGFLLNLQAWTRAERILTLLDESSFVGSSFERAITSEDLTRFCEVLRESSRWCDAPSWRHQHWLDLVGMLQDASTADLQDVSWRVPRVNPRWAAVVQGVGVERYGEVFRFLGYDLTQFRSAPVESRRRTDSGTIQFSVRPFLGDCLIFSGTADADFACFRLGKKLVSPFAGDRFIHPDTRWYNLASSVGSRHYFQRHSPQILDFFAQMTARRLAEGKRVLLVAKKCFVQHCRQGLAERFSHLGLDVKLMTEDWTEDALKDPNVVPIINYGMIGTNLFENFDAVYCLTSFYVNEDVVNRCLQDVTRQDLRLPIRVETVGSPKRRQAVLTNPEHHYYDTAKHLQAALEFKEHNVVVQAVGRVRPFTKPREVITFQMGELPGVVYDAEFKTLTEIRRYFGIGTSRERTKVDRKTRVKIYRESGLTQAETAKIIGVTERTVRNYERKEDRKRNI